MTTAPTALRSPILDLARTNTAYRRVVTTGKHQQVVVMTISVGGEIGIEIHPDNDQVLLFVEGIGEVSLGDDTGGVSAGDLVFVQAGVRHRVRNSGAGPLRLVTTYAPPHHPPGTVHETAADADAAERDHKDAR